MWLLITHQHSSTSSQLQHTGGYSTPHISNSSTIKLASTVFSTLGGYYPCQHTRTMGLFLASLACTQVSSTLERLHILVAHKLPLPFTLSECSRVDSKKHLDDTLCRHRIRLTHVYLLPSSILEVLKKCRGFKLLLKTTH